MNTPVMEFLLGDVVEFRRLHPCGARTWQVDRVGADIGLRCTGCQRHLLIERRRLEGRIVRFLERGNPLLTAAVRPGAATGA